MNLRILHFVVASLLIVSSIITAISLVPGIDWARFDRTSSVGPLDYTLSADFDAVGFRYSMETKPAEGGGGIIGGIGGDIGSNVQRDEDWKAYPKVDRSVLDNLGVIYDSYKEKSFQYELLMRDIPRDRNLSYNGTGSPSVKLNVTLTADLVPFWPSRGSRSLDIDIVFTEADLTDQVTSEEMDNLRVELKKIRLLAKVDFNEETGQYGSGADLIKEMEMSEVFTEIGQSFHRSVEVEFPDGENAAGFLVEIEASLTDYWGRQERSPLSGKANPINIRPVDMFMIVRGAGIGLALPLLTLSIILSLTGSLLILLRKKNFLALIIPACILSITGVTWYWSGMNAAVGILGERLSGAEEGLKWSVGFLVAIIGASVLAVALALSIISRVLYEERQDGKVKENSGSSFGEVPSDEPRGSKMKNETSKNIQFKQIIEDSGER